LKYKSAFLGGIWVTFKICTVTWVTGMLLGAILGFAASKSKIMDNILRLLSFLVSGIPVLVFLFWLHYPAQSMLGISVDPFYTATFMLSLLNTLTISMIVKTGLINIPSQFIEVAQLCAMNSKRIFFKIEMPLVLRHIIPSILFSQVNILHTSLFASLISVEEIFRISQRVIAIEYKPVEVYTALGVFFLCVSLPVNGLAIYLKNKFTRSLSER
jgi:His/Glu/Gln/Arg/opine family amino acid ABC transporter permease subunit